MISILPTITTPLTMSKDYPPSLPTRFSTTSLHHHYELQLLLDPFSFLNQSQFAANAAAAAFFLNAAAYDAAMQMASSPCIVTSHSPFPSLLPTPAPTPTPSSPNLADLQTLFGTSPFQQPLHHQLHQQQQQLDQQFQLHQLEQHLQQQQLNLDQQQQPLQLDQQPLQLDQQPLQQQQQQPLAQLDQPSLQQQQQQQHQIQKPSSPQPLPRTHPLRVPRTRSKSLPDSPRRVPSRRTSLPIIPPPPPNLPPNHHGFVNIIFNTPPTPWLEGDTPEPIEVPDADIAHAFDNRWDVGVTEQVNRMWGPRERVRGVERPRPTVVAFKVHMGRGVGKR
ncbi:hypothetical protein BC829DRAFT_472866 [Chytridium lagenaria]|nr:hypothetical protein BC829DRAFT_472866 [Chytridium lagenaria]